ncbi:hypothetical protein [Rubritalea tangerina]|uniref:hypothetical protein n=1 Tax=Rubritalea tangerina TaxID=430798 RepID=UPI00360F57C5
MLYVLLEISRCRVLRWLFRYRRHNLENLFLTLRLNSYDAFTEAVYSGLWSFIIVNLMNIIPSSKSWVRIPELSAFHAMRQISF